MTELTGPARPVGERRCAWCNRPVVRAANQVGRPPLYCRRSCRQRAYEARRRSEELGVTTEELVVTRNELDDLNDRLYEVGLAVRHAREDLDDGAGAPRVLERLLAVVDSLVGTNADRAAR